jgi:hypothetical protein
MHKDAIMKTNSTKLLLCNAAQMFAGQALSSLQVLKRQKNYH